MKDVQMYTIDCDGMSRRSGCYGLFSTRDEAIDWASKAGGEWCENTWIVVSIQFPWSALGAIELPAIEAAAVGDKLRSISKG